MICLLEIGWQLVCMRKMQLVPVTFEPHHHSILFVNWDSGTPLRNWQFLRLRQMRTWCTNLQSTKVAFVLVNLILNHAIIRYFPESLWTALQFTDWSQWSNNGYEILLTAHRQASNKRATHLWLLRCRYCSRKCLIDWDSPRWPPFTQISVISAILPWFALMHRSSFHGFHHMRPKGSEETYLQLRSTKCYSWVKPTTSWYSSPAAQFSLNSVMTYCNYLHETASQASFTPLESSCSSLTMCCRSPSIF